MPGGGRGLYLGGTMFQVPPLPNILGLFTLALALVYGARIWRLLAGLTLLRVRGEEPRSPEGGLPSVSVVVAARDEASRIPALMDALLGQDYPEDRYEVVLVDDRSADGTAEAVREGAAGSRVPVRVIRVEESPGGWKGKSWALHRGVEEARGEVVLTTDADCLPPPGWITRMAGRFAGEPDLEMLAGPVDYLDAGSWSWPRSLLRTEFVTLSIVAAGAIGEGKPLVASGQNLAYRKRLYGEIGGAETAAGIESGDDVFLLFQAHRADAGIGYLLHPEASVRTEPPEGPGAFYRQRARWAGKGVRYPAGPLLFSLVVWLINGSLFLGLPWALAAGMAAYLPWWGTALLIKGVADLALVGRTRILGVDAPERDYLTGWVLHVPYVFLIPIAGQLGLYRWK
ncbi:MAG: glycosyltransferase [bacterium]